MYTRFYRKTHQHNYRGCPLINDHDQEVSYICISENKHISFWEDREEMAIFNEYSRIAQKNGTPYYPNHLARGSQMLNIYFVETRKQTDISLVTKIENHRHSEMDLSITEVSEASRQMFKATVQNPTPIVFLVDPA